MIMIMIGIIFKDREYHPKDYNDLESFYMMDSLSDRGDWRIDLLRWNEAHPDKPVQRGQHRRNLRFHHDKPSKNEEKLRYPTW